MRRLVTCVREGILYQGLSLVIMAVCTNGCSTGNLSPTAVVGPNKIEKRLVGVDAFGPGEVANCYRYGGRNYGPSLLPGDRLRMEVWSAGTQHYDYKNAFPPLVGKVTVSLRAVKSGHLDVEEQQALATFLQVNRSPAWQHESDSQGDGITRLDRQRLAAELKTHEAAIWNAFVRSLCVKAIAPDLHASPVLVVQADIRALCNALPDTRDEIGVSPRQRFARAFLVTSKTDDEYLKGCSARTISREPMTVVGLRGDAALGSWSSTALAANAEEGDDYYAQELVLASPKSVQGVIEFDAVAPFRAAPPLWSLREWEEAEICLGPARAPLEIKAVRLRGGSKSFRIVEDHSYTTTHNVVVTNGRRELVTLRRYSLDWSLPVGALFNLTAADVDEIIWAPERKLASQTVAPLGCVMRGRY